MHNIRWLLTWVRLLWSLRNETANNRFLTIMEMFTRSQTPLAVHARMYLNWLNTYDVQAIEHDSDSVTITFYNV